MQFFVEGCSLPAFQDVWCTNATFPPSPFTALGKGTNPTNPWRKLLESKRLRLGSLDEFRDSLGRAEHIPNPSQEQHRVGVNSLNPWKQQHSKQNSRMAPCPKNPQGNPGVPKEEEPDFWDFSQHPQLSAFHGTFPLHKISGFQRGEALGETITFHISSNRELFQGFVSPKIPTRGEKFSRFPIPIPPGTRPDQQKLG